MEPCATLAKTAFLSSLKSDALARAAPSKVRQTDSKLKQQQQEQQNQPEEETSFPQIILSIHHSCSFSK